MNSTCNTTFTFITISIRWANFTRYLTFRTYLKSTIISFINTAKQISTCVGRQTVINTITLCIQYIVLNTLCAYYIFIRITIVTPLAIKFSFITFLAFSIVYRVNCNRIFIIFIWTIIDTLFKIYIQIHILPLI